MTFSFIDISVIKKLEKKLALNARLAALGEMSAGIAHEIRNPLGSIQIYMDLLKKRIGDEKQNIDICNQVTEEVDRLNAFITEFLVYARPPRLAMKKENIHKVIDEVINYLPIHDNSGIHIVKNYDTSDNSFLKIDKEQIKRALLNIFLNSLDALKNSGTITVETSFKKTENKSGNFCIRIKDNGTGIEDGSFEKIFDPFFSTKENGTGLGLPITEKIIREHNGRIEVSSDSRGTVFSIFLNRE